MPHITSDSHELEERMAQLLVSWVVRINGNGNVLIRGVAIDENRKPYIYGHNPEESKPIYIWCWEDVKTIHVLYPMY